MATKQERKHKEKVASLGCALCFRLHGPHSPGPVELHHIRTGGWGKGGYETLIPLCYEHHRGNTGIHGMGTKAFERSYKVTQQELLDWTLKTAC
jgi:hypothetical protein